MYTDNERVPKSLYNLFAEIKIYGWKKVFLFISWQGASINMRLKYAEKIRAREPVLFF